MGFEDFFYPNNSKGKHFKLIDNYVYLYHTDEYLVIPTWPESIADSLKSTFSEQNALSRSAPVLSYSHSGPRQITISLHLHRSMLEDTIYDNSKMNVDLDDDIRIISPEVNTTVLFKNAPDEYMLNPLTYTISPSSGDDFLCTINRSPSSIPAFIIEWPLARKIKCSPLLAIPSGRTILSPYCCSA